MKPESTQEDTGMNIEETNIPAYITRLGALHLQGDKDFPIIQRANITRKFDPNEIGNVLLHLTKETYEEKKERGIIIEEAYIIGAIREEESDKKIQNYARGRKENSAGIYYLPAKNEHHIKEDGTVHCKHLWFQTERNLKDYQPYPYEQKKEKTEKQEQKAEE